MQSLNDNTESTNNAKQPSFVFSTRCLMCVLLFFGYCLNYMQKIDMGIAIVCMVNQTAVRQLSERESGIQIVNNMSVAAIITTRTEAVTFASSIKFNRSDVGDRCAAAAAAMHSSSSSKKYDGNFVWSKSVQGLILSAYFYGYILTQIPGGWLSFRFGGRIVLGLSMGIGSLLTITIPFCARWSSTALFVCLFFTGMAHGAFWPSVSSFWSYWAPVHERSRLVGISSSGAKVGNIAALSLGGVLCVYGFDGGWPTIFYTFGIAGVCWSALFFVLATDTPRTNRLISDAERAFILAETRKTIRVREICQSHVPWKAMLTNRACYSIFIGHFAHNWGNYLFLTQTPSFLKDVLHFDMKSNGLVSSIPYIVCWLAINCSSIISDQMLKRQVMSRTNIRRMFSALGLFLPAAFIIGLSFVDCTQVYLGVTLLTLGVASDSLMTGAGYLICMNDIAGPYSGILFGLSNTIATIPGIISPYIAAVITKHQTQREWQIVFIICAAIYVVGGVFDLLFLDSTLQPWAKVKDDIEVTVNEPIADDIKCSAKQNDTYQSDSRLCMKQIEASSSTVTTNGTVDSQILLEKF